MSKEFSFPNKGTCSKQTNFVLNDDHTIASIEVVGVPHISFAKMVRKHLLLLPMKQLR